MTPTSYKDLDPDSSLTDGTFAVSGDILSVDGLGGLLLEGKTIGASAGVAELDGMLADASGVAALTGPSADIGGAPSGANVGAVTGVETAGDEARGEPDGAAAFGEGVGGETVGLDGEVDEDGDAAGDFEGETGIVGREVDGDGDAAGDFEGETGIVGGEVDGDVAGDFEGETGVVGREVDGDGDFEGETGRVGGEVDGDVAGDFEGDDGGEVVDGEGEELEGDVGTDEDVGDDAGALSPFTVKLEFKIQKAKRRRTRTPCICCNILIEPWIFEVAKKVVFLKNWGQC